MAVGGFSTHAAPVSPTGRSLRTRCTRTGSRVEFRGGLDDCEDKITWSHRSYKPAQSSLQQARRYSDYSIPAHI
jgi:hypothetical protein